MSDCAFGYERRRARREHRCGACPDPIAAGESHETWVWIDGGSALRVRAHAGCAAVMQAELDVDDFIEDDTVPELLRGHDEYPAQLEAAWWSDAERTRLRRLWAAAQVVERESRARWAKSYGGAA